MAEDSKSWVIPCLIGTGAVISVGAITAAAVWWYKRSRPAFLTAKEVKLEEFDIPVARVDKMCVYPLKSAHRVELESSDCLIRGLKYDRCWAIKDKDNQTVTMRKYPQLARIKASYREEDDGTVSLILSAPDMDTIAVPQPSEEQPVHQIKIWELVGEGSDIGDIASEWISKFLNMEGCRMLFMSPSHRPRLLRNDYRFKDCGPDEVTSFSDFSPMYLTSEESLEVLNSKLQDPVPMTRFRPNLVLSGCLPHAEDHWTEIKIGKECVLRRVRPGARCKMTTVDQEAGEFTGSEPIETLKTYRMHKHVYGKADSRFQTPLFGSNYAVIKPGRISVGDNVWIRRKQ